MALIIKDFDFYSFKYSSMISKTWAFISCFNGKNLVGTISFSDDDSLPSNSYSNNAIRMKLHISRFNDVIGILRYEKPLQMLFDDTKLEAWIQTKPAAPGLTHEPVGEQE